MFYCIISTAYFDLIMFLDFRIVCVVPMCFLDYATMHNNALNQITVLKLFIMAFEIVTR